MKALYEQAPLREVMVRPSWLIWWTDKLTTQKSIVNNLFRKHHKNHACIPTRTQYQEERRKYKTAIKQAKRTCWQKFVADIENVNAMARLGKIIRYHPRYEVGLVKNAEGELTKTPEDSL